MLPGLKHANLSNRLIAGVSTAFRYPTEFEISNVELGNFKFEK